uniref:Uncharacterized protein LOC113796103 n=1 Tax=Dermatophagoides pteronyssinus TaxID=6956 RepID=A0A6P6Y9T1_DERPT|nr:uncharacterized protein LOC113796103 [Dermatophagoides pteronyssinus]
MDDLPRMLLLASTQFTGIVNDTQLSKSVRFSTSAGLPHFANSYMREWGRDTFISAPGLFVTTERFDELESIIVSYLQVTRHYLVPNLLDGGTKPRYNCRDAIWFLFYTTICYDKYSPRCIDFLQTYVEADPLKGKNSTEKRKFKIIDLLIKLLLIYEEGIDFIEENAGPEIDEHMTEEGFHITLKKDENSFIVGGNKHNCLTWMDKMGSSVEAKNKGVPSTSRNGAPIELTALCLYSLRWVLSLNERGIIINIPANILNGETLGNLSNRTLGLATSVNRMSGEDAALPVFVNQGYIKLYYKPFSLSKALLMTATQSARRTKKKTVEQLLGPTETLSTSHYKKLFTDKLAKHAYKFIQACDKVFDNISKNIQAADVISPMTKYFNFDFLKLGNTFLISTKLIFTEIGLRKQLVQHSTVLDNNQPSLLLSKEDIPTQIISVPMSNDLENKEFTFNSPKTIKSKDLKINIDSFTPSSRSTVDFSEMSINSEIVSKTARKAKIKPAEVKKKTKTATSTTKKRQAKKDSDDENLVKSKPRRKQTSNDSEKQTEDDVLIDGSLETNGQFSS